MPTKARSAKVQTLRASEQLAIALCLRIVLRQVVNFSKQRLLMASVVLFGALLGLERVRASSVVVTHDNSGRSAFYMCSQRQRFKPPAAEELHSSKLCYLGSLVLACCQSCSARPLAGQRCCCSCRWPAAPRSLSTRYNGAMCVGVCQAMNEDVCTCIPAVVLHWSAPGPNLEQSCSAHTLSLARTHCRRTGHGSKRSLTARGTAWSPRPGVQMCIPTLVS